MVRRKEGGFDFLVKMPWPAGIISGVLGYIAIRYGIGWFFSSTGNPILTGMGRLASNGALASLAWAVLGICWLAAGLSWLQQRKRKQLLETQSGLDSLATMTWREFETLVGEAFRRIGYSVEETGGGGKDGGVDLILRKVGRMELVQCKQWKDRQVNVSVVREMWGLLSHHSADAVKIVCIGSFTEDATDFAKGKSIELITGAHLLELIRSVQSSSSSTNPRPSLAQESSNTPQCPKCGQQCSSDSTGRRARCSGAVRSIRPARARDRSSAPRPRPLRSALQSPRILRLPPHTRRAWPRAAGA